MTTTQESDEPLLTQQPNENISQTEILKTKAGYRLSLFTFFLCGVGNLLPWNFLITPRGYWMLKLKDDTNRNSSSITQDSPDFFSFLESDINNETNLLTFKWHQSHFATNKTPELATSPWVSRPDLEDKPNQMQDFWENFLSISSMLPMVIAGFLTSFGLILKHSSSFRILTSLKTVLFCLLFNQVYIFINVEKMVPVFFITTLIAIVIMSFTTQVFGCSVSGVATKFGEKHIGLMLIGQAAAGVLAAVASIFSILILGSEKKFSAKLEVQPGADTGSDTVNVSDVTPQPQTTEIFFKTIFETFMGSSDLAVEKAAFCFFLFAIILVLMNIFVYYKFVSTEIYKYLFGEASVSGSPVVSRSLVEVGQIDGQVDQDDHQNGQISSRSNRNDETPLLQASTDRMDLPNNPNPITPNLEPLNWKIFLQTIKLTKSTCFQVSLANFINLALFPSICSSFTPENIEKGNNIDLYRSIWVFLNFNLGDCCGRVLAGLSKARFGSDLILNFLHLLRLFFVVVIPVCNVAVESRGRVPVLRWFLVGLEKLKKEIFSKNKIPMTPSFPTPQRHNLHPPNLHTSPNQRLPHDYQLH